ALAAGDFWWANAKKSRAIRHNCTERARNPACRDIMSARSGPLKVGGHVFAAERRQVILELVRTNGAVSLRDLAKAVHSSDVTVRRDVRALEASGLLDCRHGGAVFPGVLTQEPSYSQKSRVAADAKFAIAELAATLVDDGD